MRAVARALHRAALHAYPASFRDNFSAELDRMFDERLDRASSRSRAAFLAAYLVVDALLSGLAERRRARQERRAWPRHAYQDNTRSQTMTWESIRADVRLAMRQGRRAPLFALLTVASLALGIGVNSAMFGVLEAVILKPLPYAEPGRLVAIWSHNTNNGEQNNPVSPANYEAFKSAPSLTGVEGMYSFLTAVEVRIGPEPELVMASQVTPGMFSLLGRQPLIGAPFDGSSLSQGVILSHQFWQRRFGGDPSVLGKLLVPDGPAGETLPVVAVMPPDFTFPYGSMLGSSGLTRNLTVDLWLAMSPTRDWRLRDATGQPNRSIHYFAVVGRLAPERTVEGARSELTAIAARRATDHSDTNAGWGVTVRPLLEQAVGSVRPSLILLMGAVGVVLLITCINVSNVLLARASARRQDLSIRSALGASRIRLMQQAIVESTIMALAGGAAGLGIMLLTIRATLAFAPPGLPRFSEVSPGTPVLLFALGLSVVTGIVVGLLPAAAAGSTRARGLLRGGMRSTASAASRRTRSALIVAEVALAMTMAVGAGLLLRSFASVLSVDPGFHTEQLLTLQMSVPDRYTTNQARVGFYDDLEARLMALPGVTAVGGTTRLPLWSTNVTTMLDVEGRALAHAEMPEVEMRRAVFDYFGSMGIPVLRGRAFTRDDTAGQPSVVVVNAALAARVFPGEDALGKRVRFGSATAPWLTIVGVVGDVKHGSLEEAPKPELYVTYRQGSAPVNPFLVLRTGGDASALAGAVRQAAIDLGADAPTDIRTMAAVRSNSVASRRFMLLLVGTFGVLALGLAALGVFGVITLITAERTTEVGIRLALGATPTQVLSLVMAQALKLALAGIAIGAAAALALSPIIEAQLFGVRAVDPMTYTGVALALTLTSLLAALLPARRAMRVDPAHALRN